MHPHIAVVIGGGPIEPTDTLFDLVIAADSGYDAAVAAGLEPDRLVGDLDSISAPGLAAARAAGVPVESHDRDKDHTDTSLALHRAVESGAARITMLGPVRSDRLDHVIAALAALGDPVLAGCEEVDARLGGATVHVVHPGRRTVLDIGRGDVFTLLALHGPCGGVSVGGARWPLAGAELAPGSTLGVSNESDGVPVTVSVEHGVLTVIVPSQVSTGHSPTSEAP